MLAFLESLCGALSARDAELILRLLQHPLAQALPRAVRDEARGIANGNAGGNLAPLQALQLYHQTAHLLGACADPAQRRPNSTTRVGYSTQQIELPFERIPAR
ncbi:MAG: hypothetical protein MNPFHGCM_00075 [Gemmatimonadaceae bacterium]|nr:hypothetical protein [Gemmatimonadaceae bacterium]